MRSPTTELFNLIGRGAVCRLSHSELEEIFDKDILTLLQETKLLAAAENRSMVPCGSCDDPHAVYWQKIKDGIYVTVCDKSSTAAPQRVQNKDIMCGQISRATVLTTVGSLLGATTEVKALNADEVWNIGTCKIGNQRYTILFLASGSAQRHISFINQLAVSSPVIVLTQDLPPPDKVRNVHFVKPENICDLHKKGLRADTVNLQLALEGASRRIALEEEGDLKLDGNTLCNIPAHSNEFAFVAKLMKQYGIAVSHEDLYKSYMARTGKASERTAQKYCNDTRSAIRKLSGANSKIVNKIIVSTKTTLGQNAYKIQNPIEKIAAK